jgi:spore cortex formation protein SpoVR/YcgB (stage V sporulation)
MKTHLILTPYKEKNIERLAELEKCYTKNFHAGFDHITFLVEEKDAEYARGFLDKIQTTTFKNVYSVMEVVPSRPAFQEYILEANRVAQGFKNMGHEVLNIVCNSDIYFEPEEVTKIKNLPWDKYLKLFVALSRWDVYKDLTTVTLLDRPDSADTWVWKGFCAVKEANCPIGVPGVDNSLAYKFSAAGYNVVNPSRDIITRHLHLVKGNNYRVDSKIDGAVKADMLCPEPYTFHTPIFSNEIK